ncbi:MAG TPA: hypothetical protein VN853_20995 [Polyangia bacterium]|jgi:hypothetical protein|nr:hypothetical protein [Polyangia bacterium]
MSDCDWQGMGVFGTQVLAPGPSDLPSTEITPFAQQAIDEATATTQAGTNFTDVQIDSAADTLTVTLTRTRKTRAVLVSVNFTGSVIGFATASDLAFRVLVNGTAVPSTPTDNTDLLLVRRVHVDLTPGATTFQPSFTLSLTSLIPPEVLPNEAALDFLVQFEFLQNGLGSPQIMVFPREDALVVKEIGPFSL